MPTPLPAGRRPARRSVAVRALVVAAAGAALAAPLALAGPAEAADAADPSAPAAGTAVATDAAPMVVVGLGGIRWSDVGPTTAPALWSLLQHDATAVVTVRAVKGATCPADGWLTLSAGQRAADLPLAGAGNPPPCLTLAAPTVIPGTTRAALTSGTGALGGPETYPPINAVTVPRWSAYEQAARGSDFSPTLGLLGQELATAGKCATAIGPGAAIALADRSGRVASYVDPGTDLGRAVQGVIDDCPLTVVDAGSVRGPTHLPSGEASNGILAATQVRRVDAGVGAVLAALPPAATLLVVGLADSGAIPHLRVVAMRGPGYGAGLLDSASTRQRALIQLTDLTPTVMAHVGLPIPETLGGSPLVRAGGSAGPADSRRRQLIDYDTAADQVHTAVPRFFLGLVISQLVLYGLAAITLRRRWTGDAGRRRTLSAVRQLALLYAAVPVSTFLANTVPWWRAGHPVLALTGLVAAYAVGIFAIAELGPWRTLPLGDVTVVATITLLVLAIDVMTGSRLQLSSLMGLQPVVAGRFYGMGNVTYALFATGGLFLAVSLADPLVRAGRRRQAALAVALAGVFTIVVDGWPSWGADFGGPPASVPAFAYLTLAVIGIGLSWRRVLAIIGGTVVIASTASILDWLRPPESRTHLGKFVQTVIDGGAGPVLERKLDQNFDILVSSPLSLLVPVGVLFVVLVLLRPTSWGANALQRAFDRSPVLRPGLVAVLVVWIVGFSLNDSGTAIPAISATMAIPLVIVLSISALTGPGAEPAPPASPRPPGVPSPRRA